MTFRTAPGMPQRDTWVTDPDTGAQVYVDSSVLLPGGRIKVFGRDAHGASRQIWLPFPYSP